MFLETLQVLNFRNLAKQKLSFKNLPTIFYGDNAQGKTNLLEAIYILSTTKSFRTRSDSQLVTWGEEEARIVAKADLLDIEVAISAEKKEIKINKQSRRATDLIGSFITIVFSPSDIDLISGGPDKRRRFLDQLGSNLSKEYLLQLVNFNKVVKARNQILYNLKQGRKADIWVWDKQLSKSGSFLWFQRRELVKKLNEDLKKVSKKLAKNNITIDYQPLFDKETKTQIEEAYLKKLERVRGEEVYKTITTVGPHRDDFKVLLEEQKEEKIVSKDLGIYGSRGEQRTAALALKLSEVSLIEKEKGTKPILLLDEVLSELDQTHRVLLLNSLKGQQSFITATSLEGIQEVFGKVMKKYLIEKGVAKEQT